MRVKALMKKVIASATVMLLVLLAAVPVFGGSPQYGCKAILPENQIDSGATYFDLLVTPGMEQTIQMEVYNLDEKPIVAQVALNTASTAPDGVILYTEAAEPDPSLSVSIANIAKVREAEKQIEPGQSVLFDIDIKVPAEEFNGTLLGGVVVTSSYVQQETESEQSGGMSIENQVRYITGLKIRMNENIVKPDFQFVSATAGLSGGCPDFKIRLLNASPLVVKEMKLNLEIHKKGETKVLYSNLFENAEMAPQSPADFTISFGRDKVNAGDYTAHAVLEYEGESWTWDEDFVIAPVEAQQINNDSIADDLIDEAPLPQWVFIAIGAAVLLIVVLLVVLAVVVYKNSQAKKKTEEVKKEETSENKNT